MSAHDSDKRPIWAQDIDGHVALVTGAGRGLGRACALALSATGARIIAISRTAGELETLADEAAGPVEAWVEDADRRFAPPHASSRSTGSTFWSTTPEPTIRSRSSKVTDEVLDGMLDLNVRAAFRVARSAARVMMRRGTGSIVNMSSQMGHVGSPRRTVYCMTKHAVEGLTKAMAVELGPHGIRVNTVSPTFIETPLTRPFLEDPQFSEFVMGMIAMKRLGTVDDVAAAVLYLASPASGIVTGTSLRVDGGWTAH